MSDSSNFTKEEQAILKEEDEIVAEINTRLEHGEVLYNRAVLESVHEQTSDPNWTIVSIDSWIEPGEKLEIDKDEEQVAPLAFVLDPGLQCFSAC
jgi:hypothetical protein